MLTGATSSRLILIDFIYKWLELRNDVRRPSTYEQWWRYRRKALSFEAPMSSVAL
jgi:hypothetical protein